MDMERNTHGVIIGGLPIWYFRRMVVWCQWNVSYPSDELLFYLYLINM